MAIIAYLLAINLITLMLFWWDRRRAFLQKRRFSERTLLIYVAAGGALGALRAMHLYHVKFHKHSFKRKIWIILVLQIIIVAAYIYLRSHPTFWTDLPETLRL